MKKALLFLSVIIFSGCWPSGDLNDYSHFFHIEERSLEAGKFAVTYFGVSTLLFEDGNSKLLIDGFFSRPSASQVIFKKIRTDTSLVNKLIVDYQLQNLDAVLVNHTHYDHALDAAYIARKTGADLYGSPSAMNLGRGEKIPVSHLKEIRPEGIYKVGNFKIEVIAGKHSPPKVLNADLGEEIEVPLKQPIRFSDYKEGGTFDFIITHGETTILVKASPNYVKGALAEKNANVVFLATGSIGTQDKAFIHSYYEETVAAVKPSLVIPTHWDNFLLKDISNLKLMPRYMDNAKKTFTILTQRTQKENIDFKILGGFGKIILMDELSSY